METLTEAGPNDFNIVVGDFVTGRDIELVFGNEAVNKFSTTNFAALMKLCGAFKSANDARRNGWDKEIPEGFSEWEIGKKKIKLTILKVTADVCISD